MTTVGAVLHIKRCRIKLRAPWSPFLSGPYSYAKHTKKKQQKKTKKTHTHTIDIDKYMVTCNLIYFWPTRLQKNGPLRAKLPASATPARVFTTPLFLFDIVEAPPWPGFHNASPWVPHCVLRNKYVIKKVGNGHYSCIQALHARELEIAHRINKIMSHRSRLIRETHHIHN